MIWGSSIVLILGSIAIGVVGGALASMLQLRDEPQAYDLLTRGVTPKSPGMASSLLLLILGFGIIMFGSMMVPSSVLVAIGGALTAFGGTQFLFRYF